MTRKRTLFTAILATLGLGLAGADLAPGMPAPGFTAQDQDGKTIRLADYKGKATVVLYFYPKDDTPGCTKEACALRDGYREIRNLGAVVLGVSADDKDSHVAFARKFDLPFPLLVDPKPSIIDAYGVRMPVLSFARRVTFIIGKDGLIRNIVRDVKAADHDKQVLDLLRN